MQSRTVDDMLNATSADDPLAVQQDSGGAHGVSGVEKDIGSQHLEDDHSRISNPLLHENSSTKPAVINLVPLARGGDGDGDRALVPSQRGTSASAHTTVDPVGPQLPSMRMKDFVAGVETPCQKSANTGSVDHKNDKHTLNPLTYSPSREVIITSDHDENAYVFWAQI